MVAVAILLTVLTMKRRPFSSVKSTTIIKKAFVGFLLSLRNMVTTVGTLLAMEKRSEVQFYLYVMRTETVTVTDLLLY